MTNTNFMRRQIGRLLSDKRRRHREFRTTLRLEPGLLTLNEEQIMRVLRCLRQYRCSDTPDSFAPAVQHSAIFLEEPVDYVSEKSVLCAARMVGVKVLERRTSAGTLGNWLYIRQQER